MKESDAPQPEGLLTLTSPHLPVVISSENKKTIMQEAVLVPQENQKIFQEKSMPLDVIFSVSLLIVLFFLIKKLLYRQKPLTVEDKIKKARHNALTSLEKIYDQKSSHKIFYTKLTNLIRQYLDERYQLHVAALTPQEFLQKNSIMLSQIDVKARQQLNHIFERSDDVKFAKKIPSPEECEEAWHSARRFILSP